MRSPKFPVVPTLLIAALVAAAVVDCGGDDTTEPAAGGSAGSSGKAGGGGTVSNGGGGNGGNGGTVSNGGNGGTVSNGGGGNGGTAGSAAGMAGKAGAGGTAGTGDSGTADQCNIHNVIHTAPTVPAGIALPVTGAALVGGYAASGFQIYTCTAAVSDAGVDGGDGGLVTTGSWVNTATATLYGDNCATAGQHAFSPGPTWTSSDGSSVSAAKNASVAAPVADGGDGGASSIAWLLLQKTAVTATDAAATFANVTWVQRVNTSGGVGPVAGSSCDPALVGADGGVLRVPYTADYFFYSGGTSSEAGSDATSDASDDGSADSGG